jgi:hypothetical protein
MVEAERVADLVQIREHAVAAEIEVAVVVLRLPIGIEPDLGVGQNLPPSIETARDRDGVGAATGFG